MASPGDDLPSVGWDNLQGYNNKGFWSLPSSIMSKDTDMAIEEVREPKFFHYPKPGRHRTWMTMGYSKFLQLQYAQQHTVWNGTESRLYRYFYDACTNPLHQPAGQGGSVIHVPSGYRGLAMLFNLKCLHERVCALRRTHHVREIYMRQQHACTMRARGLVRDSIFKLLGALALCTVASINQCMFFVGIVS